MLTLAHIKFTFFIDALQPEPNSTIVLKYYSKDFPRASGTDFFNYLQKITPRNFFYL
jgi:hypothetical protein